MEAFLKTITLQCASGRKSPPVAAPDRCESAGWKQDPSGLGFIRIVEPQVRSDAADPENDIAPPLGWVKDPDGSGFIRASAMD